VRGLTPTVRLAAILAGIALAALIVPVWLAVAAAVALLAAAGADGWTVRRPPAVERAVGSVLSRGRVSELRAWARRDDARRVLLRQPARAGVHIVNPVGVQALTASVIPHRRGRHQLPGMASASVGPLGLARVHHPAGAATSLAVYPDLVSARALIARLRRQLAGHPGRLARGPLGLGTDFESVRDYTPDDDLRQLNWRATARLGRPMSNQYRLERDRDVMCLLDTGRLMTAATGVIARGASGAPATMLDAALDAATVLALAADELGDRCGAIAFDAEVRRAVAPSHLSGRQVIEALFDVAATPVDSDFELAFTRVGRSRRALVAVFTDLVDEAAARSLLAAIPMLSRRHTVVVASVSDPALAAAASEHDRSRRGLAAALVARDVLAARAAAASVLRRAGALVVEAPAEQLPERCLDAYLRAKSYARA
jgi:uncharacterized protein (DUF58 family)